MFQFLPCDLNRLRFRRLRRSDIDDFLAYRTDPHVAKYQGWDPMTAPAGAAFLEAHSQHAALVPGLWQQLGISDLKSDTLIGDLGLHLSPDSSHVEFGISICSKEQGKGFGTECIRGLIPLLFLASPATEIVAYTDIRNSACIAVLRKAGMSQVSPRYGIYKGERCTELGFSAKRRSDAPHP